MHTSLFVGAMMMVVSGVMYFTHRTRPELVRGMTHKTFLWLCIVAFICGAFVILAQFIFLE